MELLIKKVYSKVYSPCQGFKSSLIVKNVTILSKAGAILLNKVKHLYYKDDQTFPKYFFGIFIFCGVDSEDLLCGGVCCVVSFVFLSEEVKKVNNDMKMISFAEEVFWGSLVIFIIKMNFID